MDYSPKHHKWGGGGRRVVHTSLQCTWKCFGCDLLAFLPEMQLYQRTLCYAYVANSTGIQTCSRCEFLLNSGRNRCHCCCVVSSSFCWLNFARLEKYTICSSFYSSKRKTNRLKCICWLADEMTEMNKCRRLDSIEYISVWMLLSIYIRVQ